LSQHFLEAARRANNRPGMTLTDEAIAALARHSVPGNVRELRNLMESLVIFHQGEEIEAEDLPQEFRNSVGGGQPEVRVQARVGPRTMAEIERQAILETLELTEGKRAEAAKILGIGLRTLQRKLKEYREDGHA
jgi:DNA-binding NtrC family response regulator